MNFISRLMNNILYKTSPECRRIIRLRRLGTMSEKNILMACLATPPAPVDHYMGYD